MPSSVAPRKCSRCSVARGELVLIKGHKCPYRKRNEQTSSKKSTRGIQKKPSQNPHKTSTSSKKTKLNPRKTHDKVISKKYTVAIRLSDGIFIQISSPRQITQKENQILEQLRIAFEK